MDSHLPPVAVLAADVPPRTRATNYPEPFAARVAGREKRQLGERFGLKNFGVNLTRLKPGAVSSLRHAHSRQDEFIYVLEGHPVLVTNAGETRLGPGVCAGFRAGTGDAHHLINRSEQDVVVLEVGDRTAGDSAVYPDDDIRIERHADGTWSYTREDGTPY
ncbi:MAG TPA: cupin domain-containing protein [Burkholderiales bacterium]|nr:cupin domain-containing protein [Burkholderiales bacterium]